MDVGALTGLWSSKTPGGPLLGEERKPGLLINNGFLGPVASTGGDPKKQGIPFWRP